MAPSVYRIAPYDPADSASGNYIRYDCREGVTAAYSAALGAFAFDAGIHRLAIDNPMKNGFGSFSGRSAPGWNGLDGLFPYNLTGYHDGALVPLGTALGLVRARLLGHGLWCRLLGDDGFFVHVGYERDVYVGSAVPRPEAENRARAIGLFVEQVAGSPFDPATDEVADDRVADDAFWARLTALVAERGGILLEERPVGNAYRWHRLTTAAEVGAVRGELTPRARLAAWPDLTEDVEVIHTAIVRQEHLALLVQQYPGGFHEECVAEQTMTFNRLITDPGHRAALVPLEPDDRHPLLAGVLPDSDGILRARWRTNRTRADERRTFIASLRVGDVVTGVVATGLDGVGVYVDVAGDPGHHLGFLRTPEMSWTRFDSVDEVVPIGLEIRAKILRIDWSWEQVGLSVKALQPDPWRRYIDTHQVGDAVVGTVTTLLPIGVFVDIGDGVTGLVHRTEPPNPPVEAGDRVRVTIIELDREGRRIALSFDPLEHTD
ncbi:S1 RNA-binding domain-containing protein [Embleya sp. NBC_00888]|uniref:S1 RNA-binding domain-containing protein n=1 Tax=Embleya sp. NBC_00888 TaxID=2975960 RepID=UPI00387046FF|nr:S1 RNA-binding domain-containing protein [Embleya sp. NBC_00888]